MLLDKVQTLRTHEVSPKTVVTYYNNHTSLLKLVTSFSVKMSGRSLHVIFAVTSGLFRYYPLELEAFQTTLRWSINPHL